ncbi:MAG: hypothetical protein EOP11_22665 [Proteobacteria bacterium]|nr:MAG: hypothetical protein EOP11_22665 [Pseudomonadota bacterium]
MPKALSAFLIALSLLASPAHADEYENRARAVQAEAAANQRAAYIQRSYQIRVFEVNKLNRFVAQHGGLVEDGSCSVRVAACRGEIPCHSREDATIAFSQLNYEQDYDIRTCSVNLRDGLACRVYENYFDKNFNVNATWEASCLDANGNARNLSLGAGFGNTGGAARKGPVKKRKK